MGVKNLSFSATSFSLLLELMRNHFKVSPFHLPYSFLSLKAVVLDPFFQWLTLTPIPFICQDVFQARTVSCQMTKSSFKFMSIHFAVLSLEKSNQIPLVIKNCGSTLRVSKVG